tara:strand:- start:100 stop:447 length:348 start_codon:yes stop_codon:yes gene_type:complete
MPILSTALLNESIDIQSLSGSGIDDRGNSSATFSNSATSVQCKVVRKDKGSTEVDTEGREEFNKEIHFIVPKDTTVTRADRVTYDSEYYNIRNVYNVRDRFGATMFKKIVADSGY